ncbi:MAG: hypothetical protein EA397_01770 [Deltaproteobacteria bacterium]|nr:MAG: hypothetical protein EA397_01770 [Deltaproteobacteria bacterium]
MGRVASSLAVLWIAGCGLFSSDAVCTEPGQELAPGSPPLSCDEAEIAVRYVDVLAGRPTGTADRNLILKDLAASYRTDPGRVRGALDALRATVVELAGQQGFAAAEARSRRAYLDLNAESALDPFPQARRVLSSRVAVWATDEAQQLVLTESDIEGWISYASLCREVQEGGPMRLSVAQREGIYRDLRRRFPDLEREDQIAMVALGPFWRGITRRWKAASYERQQAWIQAAPLPPPMTATSLGYAEVIFGISPRRSAQTLHETLGPFVLDGTAP